MSEWSPSSILGRKQESRAKRPYDSFVQRIPAYQRRFAGSSIADRGSPGGINQDGGNFRFRIDIIFSADAPPRSSSAEVWFSPSGLFSPSFDTAGGGRFVPPPDTCVESMSVLTSAMDALGWSPTPTGGRPDLATASDILLILYEETLSLSKLEMK